MIYIQLILACSFSVAINVLFTAFILWLKRKGYKDLNIMLTIAISTVFFCLVTLTVNLI